MKTASNSNEEELQQMFLLYQLLQKHYEELKQQTSFMEKRFTEIDATKQTVKDFKDLKKGKDIMISLGSGCYAPAEVSQSNDLLVNIGANVMIKKDPVAVLELLEKTNMSLENEIGKIHQEMNEVANKINEMTPLLEKLQK